MSGALFNTRVCAWIERENHVLLVNESAIDPFYALPGGSVEEGEFSDAALSRELREELGVPALIGGLRLICENLFRWQGQRYQQVLLLFEARLADHDIPLREGEFPANEPQLSLIWAHRNALEALDIRPAPIARLLLEEAHGRGTITHHRLRDADF